MNVAGVIDTVRAKVTQFLKWFEIPPEYWDEERRALQGRSEADLVGLAETLALSRTLNIAEVIPAESPYECLIHEVLAQKREARSVS